MSATLTWYSSGLTPKTGTTDVAFWTDLITLLTANAGNPNMTWQLLSSNTTVGAQPYYVCLGRKGVATIGSITGGSAYTNGTYTAVALTSTHGSGVQATITVSGGAVTGVVITAAGTGVLVGDTLTCANTSIGGTGSGWSVPVGTGPVGRLLLLEYTTAPGFYNTNIFEGIPAINYENTVWFPNGNINTPTSSALVTASTGAFTVMGSDVGVVKASTSMPVTTLYLANQSVYYYDCVDGVVFAVQNQVSPTAPNMFGGGTLLVDYSDTVYDTTFFFTPANWNSWGITTVLAGIANSSTIGFWRTTYGGTGSRYYFSAWGNQASGSASDIMTNFTTGQAYYAALQLLGQTKGEGIVLKARQWGYGPGTIGGFEVFYTTGPSPAALSGWASPASAGTNTPWFTNFKM